MMDSSKITRLEEEQIKAYQGTLSKLQQWETFQKDYETLEECLKTLPDKVTHEVMVPFGPMAFMPGKLIHTNEITVLLGDNWFVERSATQACGIVQRRIEQVQTMIKDLQKQKELLEARIGFTADFKKETKGDGLVDIREEYDEEKEAKWTEERRKKRTEATSQTTPRNINVDHDPSTTQSSNDKQTSSDQEQKSFKDVEEKTWKQKRKEELEAELFARLDELEKQEEEFDELARMSDFDENDYDSDDYDVDSDDDKEEIAVDDTKSKHVQWQDASKDNEQAKITFHHSSTSSPEVTKSSEASENIQSPRDVYKLVKTSPDTGSPTAGKSILKKQSSYPKLKTKDVIETAPRQPLPSSTSVFTGSVVERKPQEKVASAAMPTQGPASQPQAPQRVSKFKASRQGKR